MNDFIIDSYNQLVLTVGVDGYFRIWGENRANRKTIDREIDLDESVEGD